MPDETLSDDAVITAALTILHSRLQHRDAFTSPDCVKSFLRLQSHGLDHEVFAAMFLDGRNRLIEYERLFRGTLTQAPVFPREVAKRALALNAAAVILHHNHPSGDCTPGAADIAITRTLDATLALVDVLLLDHVVTSDAGACSMAEMGVGLAATRPLHQG